MAAVYLSECAMTKRPQGHLSEPNTVIWPSATETAPPVNWPPFVVAQTLKGLLQPIKSR